MSTPVPTRTGADPRVGTLIQERYRLNALIGRGGMCSVYRAEDIRKGTPVAVKILPFEMAARTDLQARFQREATTGKRIQHPNVVAVLDSGALDDGALFLVMELVEGRSLADVLEKGRLEVPRALAIARQILLGLDAAHRLAIAHRDIKSDNVMLVSEGGQERVKILDFGIASNERAAVKLTAAGVVFGTPEYISPEMAMGLPVDPRADLYSLGVVIYEMVTGRLPFTGELKELLHQHVNDPPPRPREVAPDAGISPELEAFILRALEKLPEKRFATAGAMLEALDAVTSGRSPARRRRFAIAAIVVVALLTAAILAAFWWSGETASAPEPQAAPSRVPAFWRHRKPHPPRRR